MFSDCNINICIAHSTFDYKGIKKDSVNESDVSVHMLGSLNNYLNLS